MVLSLCSETSIDDSDTFIKDLSYDDLYFWITKAKYNSVLFNYSNWIQVFDCQFNLVKGDLSISTGAGGIEVGGIYAYLDGLIVGTSKGPDYNRIIKKKPLNPVSGTPILTRSIGVLGGNNSIADQTNRYEGITSDGHLFYITRFVSNLLQVIDPDFSTVLNEIDVITLANESSKFYPFGLSYNGNGTIWINLFNDKDDENKIILIHVEKEKLIYKVALSGNNAFGLERQGKDLIRTYQNNFVRMQWT